MIVKDVVDAIRKNGYKQISGNYYRFKFETGEIMEADHRIDEGDVIGACAVGQAALNLKMGAIELHNRLSDVEIVLKGDPVYNAGLRLGLGGVIEGWNDEDELTCAQIADKLEVEYPELLDKEV